MRFKIAVFLFLAFAALWAQYPAGYFYIIFRNDTTCVRPVITDSVTEAEWFDYASASFHTGYEVAYESHYFFFYNPFSGNMGLVIQHNIDVFGTADATCIIYLDGEPPGCLLAISDDPGEFDLAASPEGDWHWWDNTDGGAFHIPREEFEFPIRSTFGGTDPILWLYFISGDAGEDRIFLLNIIPGNEDTVIVGHNFQGILEMQDTLDLGCATLETFDTVYIQVCNSDATSDTFHFGSITPPNPSMFTLLYAPTELAPGECDSIILIFHPTVIGDFTDYLYIDLNTPCDSFRTLTIFGHVERGGLDPVWFGEETYCDEINTVTICYEYYECDPADITVQISSDNGLTWLDAGTGWFYTISDTAGDIGPGVIPGYHCFEWLMSTDIDIESCNFWIRVIADNAVAGFDTGLANGCLDSHHPDITIDCPTIVTAGENYRFSWHIDDRFWTNNTSEIYIFGCGLDEHFTVPGTTYAWTVPLISCPSCTLVVAARDSFCNWGYDTCVFEIECIPYMEYCRFMEETNCDGQNIVQICYSLFSCDSVPYSVAVNLYADIAMTAPIPMITLSDDLGDIGSNVYPGPHCFNWHMDIDLPDSESCDFSVQVILEGANTDTTECFGCLDSRPPDVQITCPDPWEVVTGDLCRFDWIVTDMFWNSNQGTLFFDYGSGVDTVIVSIDAHIWEIPPTCDSVYVRIAVRDSFCNWGDDTCAFLPCSRLYFWAQCPPCDIFTACSTQSVSYWVADTICGFRLDTMAIYFTAATYHSGGGFDYFDSIDSLTFTQFGDSILITIDNLHFIDGDNFIFTIDSMYSTQGCATIPH